MYCLFIIWKDVHHTGIRILDEQHRGIVSIINSLHHGLWSKRGEKILIPTSEMLDAYSKIHFTTEIDLLKDSNYPDLEKHELSHQNITTDIFRKTITSKKEGDPRIFLDFLKNWWLEHINGEDMAYSSHLKQYFKTLNKEG